MDSILSVIVPSSIAGVVANALCHPLDTLKTRMLQLNPDPRLSEGFHNAEIARIPNQVTQFIFNFYFDFFLGSVQRSINAWAPTPELHVLFSNASCSQHSRKFVGISDAIRQITIREGKFALYRGFGTVMLTTIPGNIAYFGAYEVSLGATSHLTTLERNNVYTQALAGIPAQMLASFVFTPIDIVKERLQATTHTPRQVIREIFDAHGYLGFLRGYTAAVVLWAPYGAVYLASYQACKNLSNAEGEPSLIRTLGCGMVAAAIASAATTCIDVLKINLQLSDKIKSASGLAVELVRTKGIGFLFQGAVARMLYLAPRTAISFAAYDASKRWWSTLSSTKLIT